MHGFYAMHLAPTLFGEWDFVSEWGRIGRLNHQGVTDIVALYRAAACCPARRTLTKLDSEGTVGSIDLRLACDGTAAPFSA